MKKHKELFVLDYDCILHSGHANSIIIDFKDGRVFSIDKEGSDILRLSAKHYEIGKISEELGIDLRRIVGFLKMLRNLKLGALHKDSIFMDSLNYIKADSPFLERSHHSINLRRLILEINNKCSLNCINCNRPESKYSFCGCSRYMADRELSISLAKEAIADAAKFNLSSLHVLGGDPLLSGDILIKILAISKQLRVSKVSIFSSCVHIDHSVISCLSSNNVEVLVPLYSSEAAHHDAITRTKGSFRDTISNIVRLRNSKIQVTPQIYTFGELAEENSDTEQFINALDCATYRINPIYPNLCTNGNSRYFRKFSHYYNSVKKNVHKVNKDAYIFDNIHNPCLYGTVAVGMSGDITPCQNARAHVVGNIAADSLSNILKEGRLDKYWYANKEQVRVCSECERRFICHDCLILTHKYGKNSALRNRYCRYSPYEGRWDQPADLEH